MSSLEKLKEKLREVKRLGESAGVLHWDMQCIMPPGGAQARSEQLSILSRTIHEKFTSDEIGKLIEEAAKEVEGLPYEHEDVALVRVAKRNYDREIKVPSSLVAEEAHTTSLAHEIWVNARKHNDYPSFRPWLEKIVDIERQIAEHRGYREQAYDALMDPYEPGTTTSEVEMIFEELKPGLVQLVRAIRESGVEIDDSILKRKYDIKKQEEVTLDIVKRLGYDFHRGRQDRAPHPFCTTLGAGDIRITTRFDENFLSGSVFASMHEAGHALYEQGLPEKYDGSLLFEACSLGFHESQSRLWENQVGRSKEFIEFYFPFLKEKFPESLGDVSVEQFYKAANKVTPSFIRVEADEVTYNLHIMLRFELEKEMIAGKIDFKELPEIWNAKMKEYLGIEPPNDTEGVLQDVHWSGGSIGYFPTYTLGNLIAAQLWSKIKSEIPEIREQIRKGQFAPLLEWLRRNVHAHANIYFPKELIRKITGEGISTKPLLSYLHEKFDSIYGLA